MADYSTEPTCAQAHYRYPVVPCAQPAELRPRCDGAVELGPVRVACDDPSTLGPRDHDGILRYVTVEVEQDGLYEVTVYNERQHFVPFLLKECALGCGSILTGHAHADQVVPTFLRAGRYLLSVGAIYGDSDGDGGGDRGGRVWVMKAAMVSRWTLAWLAVAGTPSCAPEDPPEIPPITWVGEHLEYAPQDGAPEPCGGTLEYMDQFMALVAEEMGVELREPVVFVHGEDAAAMCDNPGTDGCAFEGGVYARNVPMEHELVHGVQRQHGGVTRFFEEGVAEAFGDDMRGSTRAPAHGDVVEGMIAGSNHKLPLKWYARAGHFAAFLHEHYGPEVTTALLSRTDWDSTAGMAVTVLEQSTGLAFEEILADYSTEPTCAQAHYRYPVVPCAQPAELRPRCDGAVELGPVRVACDDPSTLGPRDGDGMFRYLTVEVEQDGLYEATVYNEEQRFMPFSLKECALGCGSIFTGHARADQVVPTFLRAGRYVLRVGRYPEFPFEAVVRIEGVECG